MVVVDFSVEDDGKGPHFVSATLVDGTDKGREETNAVADLAAARQPNLPPRRSINAAMITATGTVERIDTTMSLR